MQAQATVAAIDEPEPPPASRALLSALYRQTLAGIAAHVLTSGVVAILLWDPARNPRLLLWLCAMLLLAATRGASVLLFFRSRGELLSDRAWQQLAVVFAGAFGVLWGASAWLFVTPGDPTSLIVITVITMGLSAGAVVALAPCLPVCFAFALPTQLGLISFLLTIPQPLTVAIALLAGYALVANLVNSVMVHRRLSENVTLTIDNDRLRRDAEKKNRLLETTLHNISQGIGLVDSSGTLQMWNQRLPRLLALPATPADGTVALADKLRSFTAERCEHHTPGNPRTVEIVNHPLRDGSRVVTVTDISPLKQREAQLQQANAAKTRFLAAASHDLRQPVNAMGLFFESLSAQVGTPQNQALLDRFAESLTAVDDMLDALLDISKLDAGMLQPDVREFDLGALLARLANEYRPQATAAGTSFRVRCADVRVRSDEVMLARALRNLVSNALRYAPGGRVLLVARVQDRRVRVEVHDDGIGIPADELQNIFVEFHQLGNMARDRRLGLGLGLAIVKRIAALLETSVEVRSLPGHGSSFRLVLPLVLSPAPEPEPAKPTAGGVQGVRVLILDDDRLNLEALSSLLTLWGVECLTAANVAEAGEKIAMSAQAPDILIVDYRLGEGVTGLDAVRELQSRFERRFLAVFLSGDTAPDILQQVRDNGFAMLHKPVQGDCLRGALRTMLAGGV